MLSVRANRNHPVHTPAVPAGIETRTWGHDKAVELPELCELLLLELLGILALHCQTRGVGDDALGVVDDGECELTVGVEAELDHGAGPGHVVDGVVVDAGGSDR